MNSKRKDLSDYHENNSGASTRPIFADSGVVVRARLNRVDMQLLDKLVEGLGHLGIVTTTNKALGEVMILSTKDCWPTLKKVIEEMPFEIEWLPNDMMVESNHNLLFKENN